ncbi:MAG TPA: dihydrodipicolinate synthase family protein [Clostridiales bacterium]|nr:dihydrodipicolinate synthase family protein [Clostridiales bacterium]
MSNTMSKDGIFSLLLTPFNEDRTIDYKAYEEYCDWQVQQGVGHLFASCGSSEMAQLNEEERLSLARLAVKHKGGTTVVATGNLEPSWDAQVEEVKRMSDTGVDGLVLVTKGYGNDEERFYSYITDLLKHTNLPVFLYEYPGYPNNKISGRVYGRLVKTGRIYGIKDTTCTIEGIKDKIDNKGDSVIHQANMSYLFESFKLGARGVMATPTTCGGAFFVRFWDAFNSGDMKLAEQRYHEIILLDNAMEGGFCATAKQLCNLQGAKMNWFTRGNHDLSAQKLNQLKAFHNWCVSNELMK